MGMKSRLKKEAKKRLDNLSKVERLVSGERNPLVGITIAITKPEPRLFRGMGFITERLGKELRLVATARHVLQPLLENSSSCVLRLGINPARPTSMLLVGQPIEDSDPETDIAFFLARDPTNAPTQPFSLKTEDAPSLRDTKGTLYNAQNCWSLLGPPYGAEVSRQSEVSELGRAYCKLSLPHHTHAVPFDDLELQAKLREEDWIECRLLQMISRAAFSGSPVFDDELRLYGMTVRGTEPRSSNYERWGDALVCLPTSQLFAARQRIDSRLQQLLCNL